METAILEQEALKLPPLHRLRLAEALTASVDWEMSRDREDAIYTELLRREQSLVDGSATLLDGKTVMAELRSRFSKRGEF